MESFPPLAIRPARASPKATPRRAQGEQGVKAQDNSFIYGVVFDDVNRNGIMDSGEKGVPGVLVSNQIQVVRTDKSSRYGLPIRDRMILFLSKPSGYDVPLSDKGIPQIFYIPQPQGSPQTLKFAGVKLTGNLPSEINFPTYKSEYREKFNVLICGDPQIRNNIEIGYFRDDIVARMMEKDAAFYLALGDTAFDNLGIYPSYLDCPSAAGLERRRPPDPNQSC